MWEAFAEHVEREQELAVSVVKVDCVANRELCTQQRIQAFPGLRLFKRSEAQMPDYRADRTVEALVNYVHQHISAGELSRTLSDEGKKQHEEDKARAAVVYPGCAMEGFLLVNRSAHYSTAYLVKHVVLCIYSCVLSSDTPLDV